jgi:[ribosomal protein S5]-alanine N-acetyltransferase
LLQQEQLAGTALRLFVFTADESQIIGSLGLTRITRGVRFDCSLSYAIRQSQEGSGLMSEAVRAAIQYAFADLGLHRIEAAHSADNDRSRRLLERLGFERVGLIRGFLLTGGQWRDTVLHSLLNPSWQPP